MLDKLKKIFSAKYLLEFALITILYRSFEIAGVKKYAVAIVYCMMLLFFVRKKQWSADVLCLGIPAVVYMILGSFAGIMHGSYQFDTVKIMLYGILSFALAFSMYAYYGKDMKRIVDIQFWGSCVVYLSLTIVYMVTRFARVESTFAFVFGIFTIYYAYQKRWKMFAFSTVFMYLADKRIVLLAVVASLFVISILWLFRHDKKLAFLSWGVVIGGIFLYIYLITSGTLEAFCWGANINTNGRVEMFGRMANEFSTGLFGNGLGVVEHILACWDIDVFANLHNDLLKFYIELGILGFLMYLFSYFVLYHLVAKNFGNSKMCFVLGISIYTIFLYATDNVSIYVMYLLPMYSVLFSVLLSEEQRKLQG